MLGQLAAFARDSGHLSSLPEAAAGGRVGRRERGGSSTSPQRPDPRIRKFSVVHVLTAAAGHESRLLEARLRPLLHPLFHLLLHPLHGMALTIPEFDFAAT